MQLEITTLLREILIEFRGEAPILERTPLNVLGKLLIEFWVKFSLLNEILYNNNIFNYLFMEKRNFYYLFFITYNL